MTCQVSYRPEIDGMRAIAVSAVLVYHLGIAQGDGIVFPGGFLGVDLFFVLSGFLITGILLQELAEGGRIQLARFYARRARRILPPMLLVMLASLPAAWAILLPSEMQRFAWSLLATLGFVSNFFWFETLGAYGAAAADQQPFLHGWSLAIEEQFYLLFPPALMLLVRLGGGRAVGAGIAVLLVSGLAVAQFSTWAMPSFSFFSPASRAWELLAGSGLAWLSRHRAGLLRRGPLARLAPLAALLVLLACFAGFELEGSGHPGLPTLPVILASCALIWFAQPDEPVTALLSTPPLVYLGKLSYAIYLWHFPIFAFGRLANIDGITAVDMTAWLGLTLALSVLSHHLVERPFRFVLPTRAFAAAIAGATAMVLLFGAVSLGSDGGFGRQSARLAPLYGGASFDNEVLQAQSWSILDALDPDEKIDRWNAATPSRHEREALWFRRPESRKVLIIGNSHSKDMFNALWLNADRFDGIEFARFAIGAKAPEAHIEMLLRAPNFAAAHVIALAPRYTPEFRAALPRLAALFQRHGKEVVVIGDTAEFDSPSVLPLFDWHLRSTGTRAQLAGLNELAHDRESAEGRAAERALDRMAEEHGLGFLSRRQLICDDAAESCALVSPEGRKTMYDRDHWTLEGAALFGRRAAEAGWFQEVPTGHGRSQDRFSSLSK